MIHIIVVSLLIIYIGMNICRYEYMNTEILTYRCFGIVTAPCLTPQPLLREGVNGHTVLCIVR